MPEIGAAPQLQLLGAWNVAVTYLAGQVVTYNGSSYVALTTVVSGGVNPQADGGVNWMVFAQGARDIAYAEYTGGTFSLAAASTYTDIAGCSIVVPATTSPYRLKGYCPAVQATFTSSAVLGDTLIIKVVITDEGGVVVERAVWQAVAVAASKSMLREITVERKMAATASDKTFKLQAFVSSVSTHFGNVFFAGTGTTVGDSIGDVGPISIRAFPA